jgi:hypothetical protein
LGIFAEKFAKNGKTGENIAKIVGKTDEISYFEVG